MGKPRGKGGRKPGPQTRLPQTFKPGQSGNPGGRPAGLSEYRALCREKSEEVLEKVMKAFGRLRSAQDILEMGTPLFRVLAEHGWGKPTQAVHVSDPGGGPVQAEVKHTHELKPPSPEQLARVAERLAQRGLLPQLLGAGGPVAGPDASLERLPPAGGGGGEPEGGGGGSVPVADPDGVPPP